MGKSKKLVDLILFLGTIYLMAYLFSFTKNGFKPLISMLNISILNNIIGWTIIFFLFFIIVSDAIKRKIITELFDLIVIIAVIMMLVHTNKIQFSFNILNYWYVNITAFLLTIPFARFLIHLLRSSKNQKNK